MDWWILIGLLTLLVCVGIGIFMWRGFVARIRDDFRAEQPELHITNLSTLNAGDVITLKPELENIGEGVAYDCVLQLSGWEGNFSVTTMYPQGPRHQTHVIPIVLRPDAPIRMQSLSRCYVRVACLDRWEHRYEYWYPVTQVANQNTCLYNVHVDISQPELTEPHLSFWRMWMLLRKTPIDA